MNGAAVRVERIDKRHYRPLCGTENCGWKGLPTTSERTAAKRSAEHTRNGPHKPPPVTLKKVERPPAHERQPFTPRRITSRVPAPSERSEMAAPLVTPCLACGSQTVEFKHPRSRKVFLTWWLWAMEKKPYCAACGQAR